MVQGENIDLFEKYQAGQLNADEAASFARRLEDESSFKNEYDTYLVSLEAIDLLVERGITARLNDIRVKVSSTDNNAHEIESKIDKPLISSTSPQDSGQIKSKEAQVRKMIPWKKWLSVAAVLLLGVIAGGYLYNQQFTTQNLTASYFETYEISTRGGEVETGLIAFEKGNYSEAIRDLSLIKDNDPSYLKAQFFLGQAYFKNKQFDQAVSTLLPLSTVKEFQYDEASYWYLTLATLNVNQEIGIRYLNRMIANGKSSYTPKAKELLRKLR